MRVFCASPLTPQFHPIQTPSSCPKLPANPPPPPRPAPVAAARGTAPFSIKARHKPALVGTTPRTPEYLQEQQQQELHVASSDSDGSDGIRSRRVLLGAASIGLALLIMGTDGRQEARALGWPEGPLAEEFWENVRRYGLYILTVSTGAIYTIFQPIVELLKNPITAVLILAVLAGGFYLVSQVLSAMVGISDFTYDYGY